MIHPVLLCGGSGTRLWPLSRKSFPKQFTQLVGTESLFQASAPRLSGADFAAPLVITGSDYRFIVTEQLIKIGVDPGPVMIEPSARNTAPAVLAAALYLARMDDEAMMLVAPSDHVVPDAAAFRAAVAAGLPAARAGRIVTFGIRPTRAETGYGWLELAGPSADGQPVDLPGLSKNRPVPPQRRCLRPGPFSGTRGYFCSLRARSSRRLGRMRPILCRR